MRERGSFSLVKPVTLIAAMCLVAAVVLYAKEFSLPRADNASSYPAHDSHPTEKVSIAAVPYVGQRASIFNADYMGHGILPIYVVFTNDDGSPIALSNMQVQFVAVDRRAKLEPSTDEDIYRKMSRTQRRGDEPSRNPLPIPLPGGGPKVGVKKEVVREIDGAQFRAKLVEAHATRAGFMFFDVDGIHNPLEGGKLYITGVQDSGGKELMYFEIALDQATSK
jgi:hypothetical protein